MTDIMAIGILFILAILAIFCGISECIAINKGYKHGWFWGLIGPFGIMIEAIRPFNIYDEAHEYCLWDYRNNIDNVKKEKEKEKFNYYV